MHAIVYMNTDYVNSQIKAIRLVLSFPPRPLDPQPLELLIARSVATLFSQSSRRLAFTSSRAQYALLCAARSSLCAALYFCQLARSAVRRSSSVAHTRGRAMLGNDGVV